MTQPLHNPADHHPDMNGPIRYADDAETDLRRSWRKYLAEGMPDRTLQKWAKDAYRCMATVSIRPHKKIGETLDLDKTPRPMRNRLIRLKFRQGMSQVALAKEFGLSRPRINAIVKNVQTASIDVAASSGNKVSQINNVRLHAGEGSNGEVQDGAQVAQERG